MLIQVERIYLFETSVSDPFFLGTVDGITTKMENERTIEVLDITTAQFFIDFVGRGGLTYTVNYGGEDNDAIDTYGKSQTKYSLDFNMPMYSQKMVEELVGKQFSLLGMRRDRTYFAIFGLFEAEAFKIDNEVQQRITLKTGLTSSKIFGVQSFNIGAITHTINSPAIDAGAGNDYVNDWQ